MAILLLPYAYEIEYVPKGKRNPQREKLRAGVPVDVREVSSREAPVAVSMTLPTSLDGSAAKGTWKKTLRYHDGVLLCPLMARGRPVALAEFGRDVARPPGDWRRSMLGGLPDGAPEWGGDYYPHLPLLEGRGFGRRSVMGLCDYDEFATDEAGSPSRLRLRSSDRDTREAEARDILAREIVVIDGDVWTSAYAREPVWEVTCGEDGARLRHSFGQDAHSYVHRFRIDRRDDALALASELVRESGAETGVSVSAATLDECDPSLLRHDDVVALSRQAMAGVSWGTTNRAQFEPWSEEAEDCLRRVRAAHDACGERQGAITALQAVSALRAALMDMPGWREMRTARESVDRTRPAAMRWEGMRCEPDVATALDEIEADEAAFGMM